MKKLLVLLLLTTALSAQEYNEWKPWKLKNLPTITCFTMYGGEKVATLFKPPFKSSGYVMYVPNYKVTEPEIKMYVVVSISETKFIGEVKSKQSGSGFVEIEIPEKYIKSLKKGYDLIFYGPKSKLKWTCTLTGFTKAWNEVFD